MIPKQENASIARKTPKETIVKSKQQVFFIIISRIILFFIFKLKRCISGYYGDPSNDVPCRLCKCPGISGNNFAKTCNYDEFTQNLVCNCQPGYAGLRCERCDAFYFGSPLEPDGVCKKCSCNGNINLSDPENCDSRTGECKNCLNNTDGFNCNRCKYGYFGNAALQTCQSYFKNNSLNYLFPIIAILNFDIRMRM